jgi:hypothetical protein
MQPRFDDPYRKSSTQEAHLPVAMVEGVSSKESEEFFSSISFQDFVSDIKEFIATSNLSEERMLELINNINNLIDELKQGFELSQIKVLFMKYVDFDINNEDEKDLFNYFVHSTKVLYEKFRMSHPPEVESGAELSTSP